MAQYTVRDGRTRVIEFDGELLADVSSRRPGAPRWTELRLYRTDGGVYVLEKIGASTVLHATDCTEPMNPLPRFQDQYPGQDPTDGSFWWCEVCGERAALDITALRVEEYRYWGSIAEDPAEIIGQLYRRKDGARAMQRMSLDLLEEAGERDEAVRDAYRREFVL